MPRATGGNHHILLAGLGRYVGQALILIAGIISVVYGIKAGVGATQSLALTVSILVFGLALLAVFARLQ
ncbi:hypothetical protein, partial [Pseudomonas asplenii]|uniref:hypothetical protein n=1 Tax=Pseudomonas asplenii TaxID=53407 RepID=UPI000569C35C